MFTHHNTFVFLGIVSVGSTLWQRTRIKTRVNGDVPSRLRARLVVWLAANGPVVV